MEAVHVRAWSSAGGECSLFYILQDMIWSDIFSMDFCDVLVFYLP